jgi:integrating conjugative element protein (TIGR03757 family)
MGEASGMNSFRIQGCICLAASMLSVLVAVDARAQVAQGRSTINTQFGAATAQPNSSVPISQSPQIEVFATSSMYISNAQLASVYRVDGRKQLVAHINQGGLPPNPQQAAAIVQQRVKAMGPEFNNRVQASLLAVEKTMVYGVQRVPAIVFDGQRVVYGVTDVLQALEIARRGGGQPIGARFAPGRRAPVNDKSPAAKTLAPTTRSAP